MQPLIRDNTYTQHRLPVYKKYDFDEDNPRKKCHYKSLCLVSTVLVIVIMAIVHFSGSSVNLNNNSPARSFLEKPDNSFAYPSSIQWKDPKKKPPPKGALPAGEQADDLAEGAAAGWGSGGYQAPVWGGDGWKAPPAGTDGTTVGGVTYGGSDVTTIDQGDYTNSEGEVPFGYVPPAEEEEQSILEDDARPSRKDPVYPTTVEKVKNKKITPSDPAKASIYYKMNGDDDIVQILPNLVRDSCQNSKTQCGFKQYSGYLLANNNAEIHYWFIEAEDSPQTKPIFVWTNGGPGCSGLDGLLTEHGPWRVTDDLKIEYNPHSWNTEVNILYLEQPFGVGFSSNEANEKVVAGDQNAADDMDAAIRNFLYKFPQYAQHQVFLSSESWGGHYVPIATHTILQNNDNGYKPNINFGGFLLGNPYTDFYENAYGFVGDIYGHGLLKGADWDLWRDVCWGNEDAIDNDAVCSAIYSRAYVSAYNANVYALDWPQCADDEDWSLEGLNRPAPSFWLKDAHIHHTARLFMEKILANHDYKALKMSLEKSELQMLHDRIAQRLSEAALEDEEYGYDYPPQQGTYTGLPGESKPEDDPSYNGMPTGGGLPGGQQQQQQMPQQPSQGTPQQGMPQQPQSPSQGTSTARKPPAGALHGRPNHNVGRNQQQSQQMEYQKNAASTSSSSGQSSSSSSTAGFDFTAGYLPCIEYDMQDYLNLDVVQQALHVKPTEWQMCSDTVWDAWPESDYETYVEAYYAEIIDNYLVKDNLKLAVYSGDDDSVCGLQGTQYWLDRWKYKVNEEVDYRQWKDDNNQLGGFYSQYLTDDGNNIALHFLTVRTAGHMVPTTQPGRALNLLKRFLYEFTNVAETKSSGKSKQDDDDDDDDKEEDQDESEQDQSEQQDDDDDDAAQPVDEPVDQPVDEPVDQQPVESQPVDKPGDEPVYQQPVDQPVDQQPPVYQQPVDQPADQQPVDQPVDQQPPVYQQPVDQPADQQPVDSEPVDQGADVDDNGDDEQADDQIIP